MIHSESIVNLAVALSKAQGKMKHAIKDANNPFFHSKYADLASVVEASRPALVANGLSVIQVTWGNTLWTMLLHDSGEWIKGSIDLKPMRQVKDKGWEESHDPQSYGSCITYARRYAMAAITGVATEDDDGNAASGKVAPRETVNPAGPPPAVEKPSPVPTSDQTQEEVEEEIVRGCCDIATATGSNAKTVLQRVSSNKDGKFGKRDVKDIPWQKEGPKGPWSPMKAVLSKVRAELKDIDKLQNMKSTLDEAVDDDVL
jgi:hypothetical protein